MTETPIVFNCENNDLIGIIHMPDQCRSVGVLIIVGGPQYRVGSHRQFVLLARHLADNGIPSMRFDYRGMGDSDGEPRTFDTIDADIKSAVNFFYDSCSGLDGVLLFGLCDAATAALFYGYRDLRIKGLILLNPWAYTEEGNAKTFVKDYYWQKIFSKRLWQKILTFKFDYAESLGSILGFIQTLLFKKKVKETNATLPEQMRYCWQQFNQPILIILSGRDLTARQFINTTQIDPIWQALLNRADITRYDFPGADHTFSCQQHRDQVADWVLRWTNNSF